jgi:hypothetical protein
MYHTCSACNKPFEPKAAGSTDNVCQKCSNVKKICRPATCSVCEEPVKGLYIWCQGCSHGGHMEHLEKWFAVHTVCPTGCGHKCFAEE